MVKVGFLLENTSSNFELASPPLRLYVLPNLEVMLAALDYTLPGNTGENVHYVNKH